MVSLTYDADEQSLLDEARRQAAGILPWDRLKDSRETADAWAKFAAHGWQAVYLPEGLDGGALSLPVLLGLARVAGERLAVEEFVGNVFLMPTLASRLKDPAARARVLAADPGTSFLLADGRTQDPTAPEPDADCRWVCGVLEGARPVRVVPSTDALTFQMWAPDAYTYEPLGDVALGVGTVHVTGAPDDALELDLTIEELRGLLRTAQLVHAAALVGAAAEALRVSVEYVSVREQFGRRIGEFQAVKHILADVATHNEAAWATCLYAGCSEAPADIAAAHILAADAVRGASAAMVQVHGGMGFTWEHPSHLFLKTAMVGARRFDPDRQLADARELDVTSEVTVAAQEGR